MGSKIRERQVFFSRNFSEAPAEKKNETTPRVSMNLEYLGYLGYLGTVPLESIRPYNLTLDFKCH